MFNLCVEQVSRMEYKPEGKDCDYRKSKDDLYDGHGKHHHEHKETLKKKVSSPAALWCSPEQGHGKDSHFFGRTKKVSAPPSAQFEALLSAACHLREVERERKKSAHEPRSTQQHHHHHPWHHHIFQQRHQSAQGQQQHSNNPGSCLQRHLAQHHQHHGQGQHHHKSDGELHGRLSPYQSLENVEEESAAAAPVVPQRKAHHGHRKERRKGSVMAPPTLEQLQAAVLEEAAKHGKKNTGPAHPLNIFGRTKKVSAPPVAQFEALLAANAKMREEERERKRSAHAPGTNHQHHDSHHPGQLLHHPPQRLDNIHLHHPEPVALLSQRKCMKGAAAGQRRKPGGDDQSDLRLDGLWITRCEGEVGRAASACKTPAERMAHELDSALAAVAKRRKERAMRAAAAGAVGVGDLMKPGMTPAEALGAEMDSALAAALIRRERKLTVSGQGKELTRPQVTTATRHSILHRSTEMLSRG